MLDKKQRTKEAWRKWINKPGNKEAHAHRMRVLRLRTVYHITEEKYQELLKLQNYKCAICKEVFDLNHSKLVHVDHCHDAQTVRGVLCHNCNRGLGFFKDSVDLLGIAIEYLKKNYNKFSVQL